jgi:hypothetical protein
MPTTSRLAAIRAATLLPLTISATPALASSSHDVIKADLVPSLPTSPSINGIAPGAAPWVLDRGEVRVRDDGRMDVRLKGFQIPRPDGTEDNPIASINVLVYCAGIPVADSGPQALSVPSGDARFRVEGLKLPKRCASPSVLVSRRRPSAAPTSRPRSRAEALRRHHAPNQA